MSVNVCAACVPCAACDVGDSYCTLNVYVHMHVYMYICIYTHTHIGVETITEFAGADGTETFDSIHSKGMLDDFDPIGVLAGGSSSGGVE